MAIGKLGDAERNIEFYLSTYVGAPDYEEALYQKVRLLYMQGQYENAIQAAQYFISSYPKSSFLPSTWFWAGESMYELGHFDEALPVYQKIVAEYPTSAKIEAAQYKLSLIQLRRREVELTKLLKWSHEELLRSDEEYQNREKVYVQAIEAYQKRLAAYGSSEDRKLLADLQQQLAKKTDEASRLAAQINAGGSVPSSTSQGSEQAARLQRLLAAKEEALALKETYLLWMAANGGAGR
jgi:tetratricopeptide (TPR) repeat protein